MGGVWPGAQLDDYVGFSCSSVGHNEMSLGVSVPLKVPISVSLQYTQVSTRWWLVI